MAWPIPDVFCSHCGINDGQLQANGDHYNADVCVLALKVERDFLLKELARYRGALDDLA